MTRADTKDTRIIAFPSSVYIQYNGKSIMLPHSVVLLASECAMSEQQTKTRERVERSIKEHL